MEKPKVLSGEAIVAKGITKIDASLPEIGLKDVLPNGSWLEQKQIQAALEARKYLIEVERIEKCGTLSHAVWRDDLMLAEVTQKVGGHWQYLGHNVGKTLYLRPEEALYLMEVNCLLLKHNEVTVSLQKAYSLLLHSSTSLIQYRVYASLSRLGYKVFKHKGPKVNDENSLCDQKLDINDSDNVDSPIFNSVIECKSIDSPNTSNYSKVSEDDAESAMKSIETNSTLTNSREDEPNEVHTAQMDVNKIDSSVSMEVDEAVGTKSEDTTSIIIEEVSSTVTESVTDNNNINNNVDESTGNTIKENQTMDVCTENQETIDSADITTEEPNINSDNPPGKDLDPAVAVSIAVAVDSDEITIEEPNIDSDNSPGEELEPAVTVSLDVAEDSDEITIEEPNIDSNNPPGEELDPAVTVSLDVAVDSASQDVENYSKYQKVLPSSDLTISNNYTNAVNVEQIKSTSMKDHFVCHYVRKIDKLTSRQYQPSDSKRIHDHFENIPFLYRKQVVTINVPDPKFIPQNIFVHNSNYLLNLVNIKRRSARSASTESAYTSSDEVNGTNIRRIRSSSGSESPHYISHLTQIRNHLSRNLYFRHFGHWRPHNMFQYYQFNMFFQRPSFPNMYMPTRTPYPPRPNLFLKPPPFPSNVMQNNPNMCDDNPRKRIKNGRTIHLQNIKNVALRLKQVVMAGNPQMQNIDCLHHLLHSYNLKYKSKLRLTDSFEVVSEEKIIETIELDDEEELSSKRPKLDQDNDKCDENLYRLRQFALRLRDLEAKDKATPSHRRAFSKAIKTFNKSYKADVYLNDDNYEIIDRRYITLESSSESDCVVERKRKVRKSKSKKLRNPFNILKRRSESLKSLNNPGTSKDSTSDKTKNKEDCAKPDGNKYGELIVKTFNKAWLPNENDFGRAEIVPRHLMNVRLVDSNKEQYLYDFMKDHYREHQNWLEAKLFFLNHLRETNIAFQNEQARIIADSELANKGLRPLIDSEDCSDMSSTIEKMRIIKSNQDVDTESSLSIDFDVYHRDVQNFRKKNPPKPHFRVICLEESSSFPSAVDVMALHSKYEDNVSIVFAIAGIGSVSYLQINPIELPIYVPKNDLV